MPGPGQGARAQGNSRRDPGGEQRQLGACSLAGAKKSMGLVSDAMASHSRAFPFRGLQQAACPSQCWEAWTRATTAVLPPGYGVHSPKHHQHKRVWKATHPACPALRPWEPEQRAGCRMPAASWKGKFSCPSGAKLSPGKLGDI